MAGNRPDSTPAQRALVFSLVDGGSSIRTVAELVFGDRRAKGRVQRLLARREHYERADADADDSRALHGALVALAARSRRLVDEANAIARAGPGSEDAP